MNRAALKALAKRTLNITDPTECLKPAFDKQLAFIKDSETLKALFCTRRAAKSTTAGIYMDYEAELFPGCNILFVGLTKTSAMGIIYKDILKVLHRQRGIKCKLNRVEGTVTYPNGSVIHILGADASEEEMNKFLGKKYRLVCIDEASMYSINLRTLVYGVLKPAMRDLAGTICLLGTASNYPFGLFHDITTGNEPGWSLHTWTAYDNPHVDWKAEIEEIKLKRPLYMATNQYKQWYLNEWSVDDDLRVYKFTDDLNTFTELPKHLDPNLWTYVLGIDFGWEDDNALVLTAYHSHDPHLYILRVFKQNKLTFDQLTPIIYKWVHDPRYPAHKIVCDVAAKTLVESMRQRTQIPFTYADKQGKTEFIELLNGDLVQGLIKIHKDCTSLVKELKQLTWAADGDTIRYPKKEKQGLPNHTTDAFLYAWRCGYHYQSEKAPDTIPLYSKKWYEAQNEVAWEMEREKLIKSAEHTTEELWAPMSTEWPEW